MARRRFPASGAPRALRRFAGCLLALWVLPATAALATPPAPEEVRRIAAEAYVFGYPLVLTGATARLEPERANRFLHVPVLANANRRRVVRPNADTLYAIAWLDLRAGPVVLDLPPGERYFVVQMLDAWSNVFAAPGSRTLAGAPLRAAITGPDWQGRLPDGLTRIEAPTNLVWIIGRTRPAGPSDLPAARAQQAGYALTMLSSLDQGPNPTVDLMSVVTEPARTPPREVVAGMDAARFFAAMAALLAWNPPAPADRDLVARMARIGLVPGRPFDADRLPAAGRDAVDAGFAAARDRLVSLAGRSAAARRDGWRVPSPALPLGRYGTRYLQRAIVAMVGHGANLPQDAVYLSTDVDGAGRPLSGRFRYRLHFPAGTAPPVRAFWSLTAYDPDGWLVANPAERYAVGSDDRLRVAKDGSVAVLVQHAPPADAAAVNWLPAPPGPFNLVLRLYWPEDSAMDGRWAPPPVERRD